MQINSQVYKCRSTSRRFLFADQNPRIYIVCLSYYCEVRENTLVNSIKKVDVWLEELLTIEVSL